MTTAVGRSLLKVPFFVPAVAAILFAILSEAVAGSYMALLAVEKIGMAPMEMTVFLTAAAVSGIAATTLFGQLHDRNPTMWPLWGSLLAKVVGFGLCAIVNDTSYLIAIALFLFGLSSASFALLFAVAKGHLDAVGGATVARGMTVLRLASSLSWAIGPALGALLVAIWSFEGVFVGASLLAIAALATLLLTRIEAKKATSPARQNLPPPTSSAVAPAAIALTAFHAAMFMGSNAMSIVVVQQLGTEADVGLLFSLCAVLEIIVMGAFVVWPQPKANLGLLMLGFALFASYFALALVWPTLVSLYLGQALRAAGIGIISIVGMAHIQELLPGRAGAASAVFGNSVSAGALLSGIGTGSFADAFGYWSIFGICAAVCVAGGLFLMCTRTASL